MRLLVMMLIALMFLPVTGSVVQAREVLIRNDFGGNVTEYRNRRKKLAREDSVRISGFCVSACTIFITLPNTCVERTARFGFHGSHPKTGIPDIDLMLDMRVAEFYRGEMKRQFVANWRKIGGTKEFHMLSGYQLPKLDPKIKVCKKK